MHSPYRGLPPRAFWRTGVSVQHPMRIKDLYSRKFDIRAEDRIVTAGSCFAHHIARKFNACCYAAGDAEPAPPGLDEATARDFGYGTYSARYGRSCRRMKR